MILNFGNGLQNRSIEISNAVLHSIICREPQNDYIKQMELNEQDVNMHEEIKNGIDSSQLQNYLALAREFQDQHLYQKAEDTLLLGLEKLPDHPFLLTRLANFYFKTDRAEQALKTLDRLIKVHTDFSFSYYLRGKIYEDLKDDDKAISDYKKALTHTTRDSHILAKLIPLLISNRRSEEGLELIHQYQDLFNDPFLFSELEAEALVELDKKVEAFNKMRAALMRAPENKSLLRNYLRLSIQTGKRGPLELYEMLSKAVPQLSVLNDEELTDIEVDYLIHHKKCQEAGDRIIQMIQRFPDRFHWRRKNVLLMKEMDKLDEIADELEILFLYNPRDVVVRSLFDDYFLNSDQFERWKQVIRKAKRGTIHNGKIYLHLRDISIRNNLLSKSILDHDLFIRLLQTLDMEECDLSNVTYSKLPFYVLETFITQISIEDKIPTPEELWEIICMERLSEDKEVPFQLEDLKLTYPVWLFALQFYVLFKTYSDYRCHFKPVKFQSEQIALIVEVDELPVEVDIQHLLDQNSRKVSSLVKAENGWRWRLPSDITPGGVIRGIPIYSESQFREILQELTSDLAEVMSA